MAISDVPESMYSVSLGLGGTEMQNRIPSTCDGYLESDATFVVLSN